jgi:hypothetical protein
MRVRWCGVWKVMSYLLKRPLYVPVGSLWRYFSTATVWYKGCGNWRENEDGLTND